ncbi:MAG: sugar phosphate isomerase/epimerase [Clostridia bacterium]|nr:sugar phosphate isomerase/epimerase [Clostridia bacterium]
MIIGMRGHDFGRMEPDALAAAIAGSGFACAQLAFTKAFPQSADAYMTPDALSSIRTAFEANGVAIPVMGCYISASDKDDAVRTAAKEKFIGALRASVLLGAGCVGTETTHFTFDESEREAAYARLLDFLRAVVPAAEECGAIVGIEPVAVHTLNTPELTRRMLQDVPSPNLKIILDMGNLLTPQTTSPEAQADILTRCLECFGEKICALHLKDGVFDENGKWINKPLGQGVMDWQHLLPRLRAHNDSLCVMREDVWPGIAKEERAIIGRWMEGQSA